MIISRQRAILSLHKCCIALLLLTHTLIAEYGNCSPQPGHASVGAVHTPPAGSPLRRAILDGLRQEMFRLHGMPMVFVVDNLLVKDGWAWIDSQPQSPDGSNSYENISALLKEEHGTWRVVEIPCGEVDNPDCIRDAAYVTRMRQRFPSAPEVLLLPVDK